MSLFPGGIENPVKSKSPAYVDTLDCLDMVVKRVLFVSIYIDINIRYILTAAPEGI